MPFCHGHGYNDPKIHSMGKENLIIKDVALSHTVFTVKQIPKDDRKKIVFIGRSNVGKSSLINKLMNRKNLARTSSKPGKTISINYYLINEAFFFVDLPGYGYAKISKDENKRVKDLISQFFDRLNNVRLVIILIDCRRGFMDQDLEVVSKIVENNDIRLLTVLTKSDKLNTSKLKSQIHKLHQEFGLNVIPFSTKSNDGKLEILKHINKALT
jgi:GTP-binding protein